MSCSSAQFLAPSTQEVERQIIALCDVRYRDTRLNGEIKKMSLLVLCEPAPLDNGAVSLQLQYRRRRHVGGHIRPMTYLLSHSAKPTASPAAGDHTVFFTCAVLTEPDPPLRHQRSGHAVTHAIFALTEWAARPTPYMSCSKGPDVWTVSAFHFNCHRSAPDHPALSDIVAPPNKCAVRPPLPCCRAAMTKAFPIEA
jgi:hypothetical protein